MNEQVPSYTAYTVASHSPPSWGGGFGRGTPLPSMETQGSRMVGDRGRNQDRAKKDIAKRLQKAKLRSALSSQPPLLSGQALAPFLLPPAPLH